MKKALGFFCVVFISMLSVFLVATGEVARWFDGKEISGTVRIHRNLPLAQSDTGRNLLTFDYFDVKRGRINFTIRAEFSQDNLPDKLEEMQEIRLSNGVIEIPIHQGLKLPGESGAADGADEPDRMSHFVLHFKTALYEKNDAKGHRVFLKNGYGTANDGTEIFFEDLVFRQRSPHGSDGYELDSEHPVTIRNAALDLTSPNGLNGLLRNTGLERLTFQPPVAALVGAGGALALGGAVGPKGSGSKLAVTCQGPLDVFFEQDPETANEDEPALPMRSEIRFRDDVVVYSVTGSSEAASLSEPEGTRFECQELRLELSTVGSEDGDRLVPKRAVATWPEGRVKGYFSKGDESYIVDGESLVWEHASQAEGDALATGDLLATGEAVLGGRPTVRLAGGGGLFFVADRALIRPHNDSVLFENVDGALTFGGGKGAGFLARRSVTDNRRHRPRRRPATRRAPEAEYPGRWTLKSDELEFRFAENPDSGRKELSEIEARSGGASGAGVILESVVQGAKERATEGAETGAKTGEEARASSPLRVTATRLTYVEADKEATLRGEPETKPRLSLGKNWIEADQMRLSAEKGEAVFEGNAHAYVADVEGLEKMRGATWNDKTAKAVPSRFEMHAPLLEVELHTMEQGADEESAKLQLGILHAYGMPGSGGEVTARSLAGPWFQLTGGEIYWDQLEGQAWLYGAARKPGGEPTVADADESTFVPEGPSARIDLEGGSLLAQEIHFDQQEWRASLRDKVTIYTVASRRSSEAQRSEPLAPGGDGLEIRTGMAEVEFFPQFRPRAGAAPTLDDLARLRRVHAKSDGENRIEIRGRGFIGRAQELDWDGEEQTLRFHGGGRQEIELLQDEFRGPLYAREVVYDAATDEIVLLGTVEARLTQTESVQSTGAEPEGVRIELASGGPAKDAPVSDNGALVWWLETDALEIKTKPGGNGSKLELVSLRARDKVRIQEESHGLLFRGDELFYRHEERKIHIYSPDGRPQVLFRTPPPVAGSTSTDPEKVQAQEIWVQLTAAPESVGAAGGPADWLHVDFERDVNASFQLRQSQVKAIEGVGRQLKILHADRLTLSIDPRKRKDPKSAGLVPAARARGKVSFQSGEFEGFSDLAVFDQAAGELILLGTENAPARLLQRGRAVSENKRILLRKQGDTWSFFD